MKEAPIFVLAIVIVASLSVGCGEKKQKSPAAVISADAFLTSAEISKGAKVNTLTSAQAVTKLKSEDDFYDDGPATLTLKMAESCITKIMAALPVKSYGSYAGVGAEVDITSCAQELFNDPSIKAAPSSLRLALQAGCNNGDFSSFEGKTFAETYNIKSTACANATSLTSLLQTRLILAATVTKSGATATIEDRDFSSNATASGQPCSETVEGLTTKHADGCLSTRRKVQSVYNINGVPDSKEGTEDFSQLETSSLVSSVGDTNIWYKSGKMKVTLNNWNGDVTYSSTSTAPTYSMSNGTETATGSLSSVKSLNLNETYKNLAKSIAAQMISTVESMQKASSR